MLFRSVLFTDESWFALFRADGRQRVWRRVGERFADVNVVARYCPQTPNKAKKMHISEWPFIVDSLRHTCALIMMSDQHLDVAHL